MTSILVKPKTNREMFLLHELLRKMQVDFENISTDDLEELDFEKERDEWFRFSMSNFSRAYGENEPDYENGVIKEPNPYYKPHKDDKQ
jgi:hypothetical protein